MSKLVLPKAVSTVREAATPVEGEILYDKNTRKIYYGDGVTAGGVPLNAADSDDAYIYGIDWDTTIATAASACKKVVWRNGEGLEVDSYSQMPAHNFRRCVMSDPANRVVAYYLNASDSRLKANGQPADLTGGDGDVMVELPVLWWRIDRTVKDGHLHVYYLISDKPFIGASVHPFFRTGPGGETARVQYVGAFRSVLCGSDGTPKSQTDDDTPTAYAAGDRFRSIAGSRPAGLITRAEFRTGSIANGACSVNGLFGQYLTLMMAIDGGTWDCQAAFGPGYSHLDDWSYAALRATGRTACLGNGTGSIPADDADSDGADYDLLSLGEGGTTLWDAAAQSDSDLKIVQCSYRGIEDPYGSQWYFEDGIQKHQNAATGDFSESGYWITNDTDSYSLCDAQIGPGPADGTFPASGYTGSGFAWVAHPWPKSEDYVGGFDDRSLLPTAVGGSSTTYLACFVVNDDAAGARVIARGGHLYGYASNGIGSVCLTPALDAKEEFIGSRLGA